MQNVNNSAIFPSISPSSESYRAIASHDDYDDESDNSDGELIPIPIGESRQNGDTGHQFSSFSEIAHVDSDEGNSSLENEMKEARPISIMLRNCFPPSQAIADANSIVCHSSSDQLDKNDNGTSSTYNNDMGQHHSNSPQHHGQHIKDGDNHNDDDEEGDTTLNNYQIFTKTSQWRDKAKRIIFLPIEMEIVVSYSFVIQLHSFQKDDKVKARIRDLFGLDNIDADSNPKTNGVNAKNSSGNFSQQKNGMNVHNFYKKKHKDDDRVIVLCSKLQDTRSSHPLWDHVNEKLDDLYDLIPKGKDLWNDLYKAMRIQFRAIVPSQPQAELKKNETHKSYVDSEGSGALEMMNCKQSKSILLATSPLHPYKLKSINTSLRNDNININRPSSILLGSSKFKESIPHSLPPNSILIHFSDGTTRVCSELFELLIQKGVLVVDKKDNILDQVDVDKFDKRFDDNVFDVLEDHGYVKAKLNLDDSLLENSQSNLFDNLSITKVKLKPMSTASSEGNGHDANIASNSLSKSANHGSEKNSQPSSRSYSRGAFVDAFESMASSSYLPTTMRIERQCPDAAAPVDLTPNQSHEVGNHDEDNDSNAKQVQNEEIDDIEREIANLETVMKRKEMLLDDTTRFKILVRLLEKLFNYTYFIFLIHLFKSVHWL